MASKLALLSLLVLSLLSNAAGFSESDPLSKKILVIIQDSGIKASHSSFFHFLTGQGYKLSFKLANDGNIAFKKYGRSLYDGAVIFAPKLEGVDLASVLDFVDSGNDLIVAGDEDPSDLIRDIATESGVDFDEITGNFVIDHVNRVFSSLDSLDTLIPATRIVNSTAVVGTEPYQGPVLFRGSGLSVNPTSELVFPVLSASAGAFTGSTSTRPSKPPALLGEAISLVAAMQARNNARVVISGSLDLFSNEFFNHKVFFGAEKVKAANQQFAQSVTLWAFHQKGHIKANALQHHKVGEKEEPSIYRIGDKLDFSVDIVEWSGSEWVPYAADDVQVQFFMMSPYVLKTLSNDGKGKFYTEIHVPDVYGVFQFKVEYKRLGFTTINLAKQIPVRPFRHDEYERFIPAAYPYYASTFSMMFGFFIFGFVFLYHK